MHILSDLFGPGTWGTGGNIVAAALLGAIGFGFRKHIAAWWRKHAANGFGDELDSIRKHLTDELRSHHLAIHDRLDQQDDLIRTAAQTAQPPPPPPPAPPKSRTTVKGT